MSTFTDALAHPHARPVFLAEITAGDHLKAWVTANQAPADLALAYSAPDIVITFGIVPGATSYTLHYNTTTPITTGDPSIAVTPGGALSGAPSGTYYAAVLATTPSGATGLSNEASVVVP